MLSQVYRSFYRTTFRDCWCEIYLPDALPVTNRQCQSNEVMTALVLQRQKPLQQAPEAVHGIN